MKVQLDNFEKMGVPHVRYFNSKFEGFQSDLEIDSQETYDLVKKYKFAEIIPGSTLPALRQLNIKLQLMQDYDFALNLDTDEILQGDWQKFEESLIKTKDTLPDEKLYLIPFEDKTGIYEFKWLHKLYYKPETMEFRFAHMWFFDKITNKKLVAKYGVKGIKIIQDDAPRPDWRERLQCRYQQWNRRKEIQRQQNYYEDEIKRGNIKGTVIQT